MKKILILFCFLISIHPGFSQSGTFEVMLQQLAAEKDENNRIDLIISYFTHTSESDPVLDMQNSQKLLQHAQKSGDRIAEVMALSNIGYDYRSFGNTPKSVEYNLKATAAALETGNEKLMAYTKIHLAHNYKDQGDYPKAAGLYLSAELLASRGGAYRQQAVSFENLAEVYLLMNKIDSALFCAQRDYELCMKIGYTSNLSFTLQNLGSIHGKMGNSTLAINYFDLAIRQGFRVNSAKQINWAYTSKAQYFRDTGMNDSCARYARKAIAAVQNSAFSNYSIKPSKLLLDIYENSNADSALKYFKIYRAANDSLFNTQTLRQTQALTFEDDLRQQKVAEDRIKAEDQRRQNIQYALIALGIVVFIILFLLLSRSFITSTKLIEFLGVLALLIVFEFLNLLLHPFLEKVTNHTPLLMLSALVCVAALLIPLHHRVEKWSTAKLVENNKKIRLAMAKKTIEKLEGKPEI